MRIATKLTLLLLLAVAVVMIGFGYLRTQEERQRLIAEFQQEVLILGSALKLTAEHALRDRQPQDIQQLLTEMVGEPNPVDRILILDRRLQDISSAASPIAPALTVPRAELEQVLATGRPLVRYVDAQPRPAAYAILPLHTRRGSIIGLLEVVRVATHVQRQIEAVVYDQVLRLSLLSLTIALVIWLTVRIGIRRPVGQLVALSLSFGRGDLSQRIPLRRRDEIGRLASAFNRMAEDLQAARHKLLEEAQGRLDLERQVLQAQKLAAVGRLASEVAHEIGTPLNIISGRAESIQKRLPEEHPASRHVAIILRQIERISGIIRQLLEYTRPRRLELRPVEVGPMLDRTADLLEPLARRRQVQLVVRTADRLPPILADPDQLQQVLLNLVTNALDATAAGGQVRLTADAETSEPPPADADGPAHIVRGGTNGPCVTLRVADTGCGIESEQLQRIFEPFFSTKGREEGTGLGLPIVEDIVRSHHGAIRVQSLKDRGTTVSLFWPLAAGAPPGSAEAAAPIPGDRGLDHPADRPPDRRQQHSGVVNGSR